MSLLPGSQGSEKDACVSLQLEQEVKIFTAQRWRWGPSVCLPLEPPCCGLLCFCDHVISPEVTPQSPLVLEVCFFLLLLQDSLLVFLSVHNIRPHVVGKCCTKGLLNCSRQRSPETNLGCLSEPGVLQQSGAVCVKMVLEQLARMRLTAMNLLVRTASACLTD